MLADRQTDTVITILRYPITDEVKSSDIGLTQVPPSRPFSMSATRDPNSAARRALAMPPEPPPITRKSNTFFPTAEPIGGMIVTTRKLYLLVYNHYSGIGIFPKILIMWSQKIQIREVPILNL